MENDKKRRIFEEINTGKRQRHNQSAFWYTRGWEIKPIGIISILFDKAWREKRTADFG